MALFTICFFIYIAIGGCLCFLYKYIASELDEIKSKDEMEVDTVVAVFTGTCWPVVAAFSFGILLAKRRRRRRGEDDYV